MPWVRFNGHVLHCDHGANLRQVLLEQGINPHNGLSRRFNCGGQGTCGTCAVRASGELSEPGLRERWRLSFPPHAPENGLRLACQCTVHGDVEVTKLGGFWGNVPYDNAHAPNCPVPDPPDPLETIRSGA